MSLDRRCTTFVVVTLCLATLTAQFAYLISYSYNNDNVSKSFDGNLMEPIILSATNDTICRRHHPFQHVLQDGVDESSSSLALLFQELKPLVLNHTLHHLHDIFQHPSAVDDESMLLLQADLEEISKIIWHSPHRLVQRSTLNALPFATMQRLWNIIEKRIQDPILNPPLHVMVFGGSIVLGNGAGVYVNRQRNKGDISLKANNTLARWSTQFELLLNRLLSGSVPETNRTNHKIIQVTNMANGGMTTGISSIPLQYQIFPDGYPGPDLILASFGYNDLHMMLAKHQNPILYQMTLSQQEEYLLHETQRFVRAALKVNKCGGESLPAILLVDDSFMIPQTDIRTNLLHSRVVNEVTSWYNLWGVSWTKVMLHHSYALPQLANISRGDGTDDIAYWPLWGGNLRTSHPNILFHVGIAWLLVYQFVWQFSSASMASQCGADEAIIEETLNDRQIPLLDAKLQFQDIASSWSTATKDLERYCATRCNSSSPVGNSCSYLWIVNRATSTQTKEDVRRQMDLVLVENKGWMEVGNPVRKPRPGWVAQQPKAIFSIRVNATTAPISKMTLIYLKSYGDLWRDTRMSITVRVRQGDTDATKGGKEKYELEGFHDSNTSVNYEADFAFKNTANIGDYVLVNFNVKSGSTFRINGMMFCDE